MRSRVSSRTVCIPPSKRTVNASSLAVPAAPENIDIWKLKLDGTGKDFTRLTHFNDYAGGKASNPVISTGGRFMAFQVAKTDDPAGVGYGILLFHFKP